MENKCIFCENCQANIIKLLSQIGAFEFQTATEENLFSPASPTSSTEAHDSLSSLSEIHYTSSSEGEPVVDPILSSVQSHDADDDDDINILAGPFSPITPTSGRKSVMEDAEGRTYESETEIAPGAAIVFDQEDVEECGGGVDYQPRRFLDYNDANMNLL